MSLLPIKISARARNNALIELLQAVNDGGEYPEAHTAICLKYRLNEAAAEQLTAEYDRLSDQFARPVIAEPAEGALT